MKKLVITIFSLLLFIGCKSDDFKISSPTVPTFGTSNSKVNFDHSKFLSVNCSQCHIGRRPASDPVHGGGDDCITCHTAEFNSAGVRSWANVTHFNHTPKPASCLSCHDSKRPTSLEPHQAGQLGGDKQECASCHNYPSWKPANFDHAKATLTSCVQCHRTATKDDRPVPQNMHPSDVYNQIDCVHCHSNSTNTNSWRDTTFDHMTHSPAPTSCIQCHDVARPVSHTVSPKIQGMANADCKSCHNSTSDWKQVTAFDHETAQPTSCIGCHSTDTPANQVAHPTATGNYSKIDCIKCHTYDKSTSPRSWAKLTFNQHTHAPSPVSCLQCHKVINNSLPKSGTHMSASRANNDCSTCHVFNQTKVWTDFTPFNHVVVEANERCDTCHNANTPSLKSKPVTHIATNLDCKSCHTNTAWLPASFSHAVTDTNCMSCHDGVSAKGKTVNHVATTLQCSSCHTQAGWKPAGYKHSVNDTNCVSCHNGSNGRARPANHNLNLNNHQCSTCHTQTTFTPESLMTNYKHSSSGALPPKGTSYHKSQSSCTKCHSGTTDNVIFKNTTYAPTCAGCHSDKYSTSKHGGKSLSTNKNCLSCHSYNGF